MKVTLDLTQAEVEMIRNVLYVSRSLRSGHADIVIHHTDGKPIDVIIQNERVRIGTIPDDLLPTVLK